MSEKYKTYVLKCGECGDDQLCLCKIGHSNDEERRRKGLQTGTPERLSIVHVEEIGTRREAIAVERATGDLTVEGGGERLYQGGGREWYRYRAKCCSGGVEERGATPSRPTSKSYPDAAASIEKQQLCCCPISDE